VGGGEGGSRVFSILFSLFICGRSGRRVFLAVIFVGRYNAVLVRARIALYSRTLVHACIAPAPTYGGRGGERERE